MFKLVSARLARPYVPNTALGPMLRPFRCNDSATTLRTLDDWPGIHGDLSLSPDTHEGTFAVPSNAPPIARQAAGAARQVTVVRAQSRRRTSFSMMPHRRHR